MLKKTVKRKNAENRQNKPKTFSYTTLFQLSQRIMRKNKSNVRMFFLIGLLSLIICHVKEMFEGIEKSAKLFYVKHFFMKKKY